MLYSFSWQLFLVQAIVGLSVGILGPAWDSLYSDDGQQSDVERWSFWTGGISLVTGLGAIMGAAILTYLGWNALFISMGIIDALAVYYSYQVLIYKEQTV